MNEKIIEDICLAVVAIIAIWCMWGKSLITINRYYNGKDNNERNKDKTDN